MGAALISVIATSSGAASAYVREGFSNIRIGMFLEIATTTGAVCGAFAAAKVSPAILGVLFGLVLLLSLIHISAFTPRTLTTISSHRPAN